MSTFNELKKMWCEHQEVASVPVHYDHNAIDKIVKTRTKKNINIAMQYFWAAFTLQIIVYAMLSHVMIKHGSDIETLLLAGLGVVLFLPFTVVLMTKFKAMAVTKPEGGNRENSIYKFVLRQQKLLQSFYNFKRRYELILIPLASAIGVVLTFKLYVPGGLETHLTGAVIAFVITLISCGAAIIKENKKNFEMPLQQLRELLKDFEEK
jgi:hypothetical protein